SDSSLSRHLRAHPGGAPFSCFRCRSAFPCGAALREHLGTPCQPRPHKCRSCPKRFASARSLQKHRRVHLDGALRCPDCGKTLT
ncbi:ZN431 protein, partial [Oreocharis arfaki]|nr:ZN431 protein [Platysteira castanea]NWW11448.1 ZN431 protein [Oreocharis arfaki]NXB29444.1 ZN431 protein [Eulacestoma nigropectus]NXC65103.1 ZN431 protein [Aleadryas rufinucha]NXJ30472.1 ZN431 protein [Dicrurus megarhynchus]